LNIAGHFVDARPRRTRAPAIVGEPREVTYGQLAALANRVGNALRAQGVFPRRSRSDCAAGFGRVLWPRFLAPQKSARWLCRESRRAIFRLHSLSENSERGQ